jgi:hypothetical protein
MGLAVTTIQLPEGYTLDFDRLQKDFFDTTGLHLTYTLNTLTEENIKRYYEIKVEIEKVNPNAGLDEEVENLYGNFEIEEAIKGFGDIEYRLFHTKLELAFTQQRYFFFSLISVLEAQGVNTQYNIPAKYKVKWAGRKWYHRLKP